MPRYFFDIRDNDNLFRDDEGMMLPGLQQARKEAIAMLPDIAKDELTDGDHHVFSCTIRDEDGHAIYIATFSLIATKLV